MGKLCVTYKMCAKCCSRVECANHNKRMHDVQVLGDPDSAIHEKRLEQKKVEMAKNIEAVAKKLHAMQEKALRMNVMP